MRQVAATKVVGASALLMALGAVAGWEGTVPRSSPASAAGVLVSIGVAFTLAGLAGLAGRGRQLQPTHCWLLSGRRAVRGHQDADRAGVIAPLVWVALVVATVGWDLYSFARQADDLPTLSRLCGDVTDHHWGRALFFALWLALGTFLALGGRKRRHPDGPTSPTDHRRAE